MKILYNFERAEVAELLPKKYSKVLEIGCSNGFFQNFLTDECEYWGVEPFYPSYKEAKVRAFKVLNGTFDEKCDELPDSYFDLVICNDVIEHMDNYMFFLNQIKIKMTQESYIVGSIPNVRYIGNLYNLLVLKDWQYTDLGILDRTHLRFFTHKSIVKMFLENDYSIEKLDGINRIEFDKFSVKSLVKNFITIFLGSDTKYFQFAFRIKYKEKINEK